MKEPLSNSFSDIIKKFVAIFSWAAVLCMFTVGIWLTRKVVDNKTTFAYKLNGIKPLVDFINRNGLFITLLELVGVLAIVLFAVMLFFVFADAFRTYGIEQFNMLGRKYRDYYKHLNNGKVRITISSLVPWDLFSELTLRLLSCFYFLVSVLMLALTIDGNKKIINSPTYFAFIVVAGAIVCFKIILFLTTTEGYLEESSVARWEEIFQRIYPIAPLEELDYNIKQTHFAAKKSDNYALAIYTNPESTCFYVVMLHQGKPEYARGYSLGQFNNYQDARKYYDDYLHEKLTSHN